MSSIDHYEIAEGAMDVVRERVYAYAGGVEGHREAIPGLADYLEAQYGGRITALEARCKRDHQRIIELLEESLAQGRHITRLKAALKEADILISAYTCAVGNVIPAMRETVLRDVDSKAFKMLVEIRQALAKEEEP